MIQILLKSKLLAILSVSMMASAIAETTKVKVDAGGNVGIGISEPLQKLDVDGAIRLGDNDAPEVAGSIRWTGEDFEGYDGSSWKSLTASPKITFASSNLSLGITVGTNITLEGIEFEPTPIDFVRYDTDEEYQIVVLKSSDSALGQTLLAAEVEDSSEQLSWIRNNTNFFYRGQEVSLNGFDAFYTINNTYLSTEIAFFQTKSYLNSSTLWIAVGPNTMLTVTIIIPDDFGVTINDDSKTAGEIIPSKAVRDERFLALRKIVESTTISKK